ncbi:MAG: hypothetical protein JXA20_11740 [Spirochaetes bacterium]|nr:hypothetical protein [Spirochaetota bacterium]
MHIQKIFMLAINMLCGGGVIFSYVHGLMSNPDSGPALWGEVPKTLTPLYTVSMFTAAAGYLLFTYYVFFRLDPEAARIGRFGYGLFNLLYLLILVPSILWMPFTFSMIANPSPVTWVMIRTVLALVGIGSLAMLAAILKVQPGPQGLPHVLAVIGCIAFSFQTAVLDALVWTHYFPLRY